MVEGMQIKADVCDCVHSNNLLLLLNSFGEVIDSLRLNGSNVGASVRQERRQERVRKGREKREREEWEKREGREWRRKKMGNEDNKKKQIIEREREEKRMRMGRQ